MNPGAVGWRVDVKIEIEFEKEFEFEDDTGGRRDGSWEAATSNSGRA